MIHENKILQDTVSLLGGFYASQNSSLFTFSKHEKKDLITQWHQLQKSVSLGIGEAARSGKLDVLLACALLLSFVQILEDLSGQTWCMWIFQIHAIVQRDGDSPGQTPLLRSMRRLTRIMNALRALCLEQDIDVELSSRSCHLGSRMYNFPSHEQDKSTSPDDQLLDYFCEDLEMWAKIQWLTAHWKSQSIELGSQHDTANRARSEKSLSEHECRGVELTCIASQFQRDIIASLFWYTSENDRSLTDVMLAFYHGANVDISQMFCDPVWLTLNCELPVMTHQMSSEQAKSALQHAENGLQNSYLEAIFYAPILYTVSVTMRYKSERSRIIDFVRKVKQKGFFIADRFLSAIEEAWAAGGE